MTDDKIDDIIENAIGELYRGFFLMRQKKQYQKEYDEMGVIINMLSEDRRYMRDTYDIEF